MLSLKTDLHRIIHTRAPRTFRVDRVSRCSANYLDIVFVGIRVHSVACTMTTMGCYLDHNSNKNDDE